MYSFSFKYMHIFYNWKLFIAFLLRFVLLAELAATGIRHVRDRQRLFSDLSIEGPSSFHRWRRYNEEEISGRSFVIGGHADVWC